MIFPDNEHNLNSFLCKSTKSVTAAKEIYIHLIFRHAFTNISFLCPKTENEYGIIQSLTQTVLSAKLAVDS